MTAPPPSDSDSDSDCDSDSDSEETCILGPYCCELGVLLGLLAFEATGQTWTLLRTLVALLQSLQSNAIRKFLMDATCVTTTKGKTYTQSKAAKIKDEEDKTPNNKKWKFLTSGLQHDTSLASGPGEPCFIQQAMISPVQHPSRTNGYLPWKPKLSISTKSQNYQFLQIARWCVEGSMCSSLSFEADSPTECTGWFIRRK